MNSEELEQSLRTEFESYLKNVLADMRQEVSEFQKQFEAEFEKHKTQLDEAFQNFSARIADDRQLDSNFTESVVEHLRLSRDEGARITAMAIAEAEELEKQNAAEAVEETPAAPAIGFSEIRDAVNDISSKTTQSAILKTLVNHASQFTPRGAFFIIKNEHLVGWRVFGKNGETVDEQIVREVFFPTSASTVLGEAIRSLSAVESSYGVYSDDSSYLNKLEFGQPERMFAVPLVVRGRTVAVLYADGGEENGEISIDALETLVRVASMTVEILASSRGMHAHQTETAEATGGNFETPAAEESFTADQPQVSETVEENESAESYRFTGSDSFSEEKSEEPVETTADDEFSYAPSISEYYSDQPAEETAASFETPNYQTSFEGDNFSFKPSDEAENAPVEFVAEAAGEEVREISSEETLDDYQKPFQPSETFEPQPAWNQAVETEDYYSKEPVVSYEIPSYESQGAAYEAAEQKVYETDTAVAESEYVPDMSTSDYQFEAQKPFEAPAEFEPKTESFEAPSYETSSYETPSYEAQSFAPSSGTSYEPVAAENGSAESYAVEAPVETIAEPVIKQPAKSRFSERNVDLPIEVSEDERRLHNDARRFARLLVSEIKLYNEQKVKEGRDGHDLYDRLREAIDRSREMYDKRVQPPVAAKFDYFHYELVNNLAEGDSNKLGDSYPGSGV